ncbi:hypothetical protein ACK6FV_004674, partial [Escherichia coli]
MNIIIISNNSAIISTGEYRSTRSGCCRPFLAQQDPAIPSGLNLKYRRKIISPPVFYLIIRYLTFHPYCQCAPRSA